MPVLKYNGPSSSRLALHHNENLPTVTHFAMNITLYFAEALCCASLKLCDSENETHCEKYIGLCIKAFTYVRMYARKPFDSLRKVWMWANCEPRKAKYGALLNLTTKTAIKQLQITLLNSV